MSEEKKDKLESIGFVWNAKEDSYSKNIVKWREFIENCGHSNNSKANKLHDKNLAIFVANIRQGKAQFDCGKFQSKHKITLERIKELESIGFNWIGEHSKVRVRKELVMSEKLELLAENTSLGSGDHTKVLLSMVKVIAGNTLITESNLSLTHKKTIRNTI